MTLEQEENAAAERESGRMDQRRSARQRSTAVHQEKRETLHLKQGSAAAAAAVPGAAEEEVKKMHQTVVCAKRSLNIDPFHSIIERMGGKYSRRQAAACSTLVERVINTDSVNKLKYITVI